MNDRQSVFTKHGIPSYFKCFFAMQENRTAILRNEKPPCYKFFIGFADRHRERIAPHDYANAIANLYYNVFSARAIEDDDFMTASKAASVPRNYNLDMLRGVGSEHQKHRGPDANDRISVI